MKITITTADGAVYKDNYSFLGLELSNVPANVHALQWNGVKGWVEFMEDENFHKPANEIIDVLPSWVDGALVAWQAAFDAEQQVQQSETQQQPVNQDTQDL